MLKEVDMKRNKVISFRVTDEEHEAIARLAWLARRTISSWIGVKVIQKVLSERKGSK